MSPISSSFLWLFWWCMTLQLLELSCSIVPFLGPQSNGVDFHSIIKSDQKNSLHDSLPKTSTGTTIVGLCCREGVVLGSDTRSTGGTVVMDKNVLKIHYISPSIRCCAAGTSADCEFLSNEARRIVALAEIDSQLAGESQNLRIVHLAVDSIMSSLSKKIERRGCYPSAVFIVGGIDAFGAQLYQIEADGTPQRLPYATLGSGSLDALSILEHECRQLPMDANGLYLNISMEDGVNIVRKAVQAGILNDLGSGSHVDLCCIENSKGKISQWREELVNNVQKPPMPSSVLLGNNYQKFPEEEYSKGMLKKALGRKWIPSVVSRFRSVAHDSSMHPPHDALEWKDGVGLIPKEVRTKSFKSLYREMTLDAL